MNRLQKTINKLIKERVEHLRDTKFYQSLVSVVGVAKKLRPNGPEGGTTKEIVISNADFLAKGSDIYAQILASKKFQPGSYAWYMGTEVEEFTVIFFESDNANYFTLEKLDKYISLWLFMSGTDNIDMRLVFVDEKGKNWRGVNLPALWMARCSKQASTIMDVFSWLVLASRIMQATMSKEERANEESLNSALFQIPDDVPFTGDSCTFGKPIDVDKLDDASQYIVVGEPVKAVRPIENSCCIDDCSGSSMVFTSRNTTKSKYASVTFVDRSKKLSKLVLADSDLCKIIQFCQKELRSRVGVEGEGKDGI